MPVVQQQKAQQKYLHLIQISKYIRLDYSAIEPRYNVTFPDLFTRVIGVQLYILSSLFIVLFNLKSSNISYIQQTNKPTSFIEWKE